MHIHKCTYSACIFFPVFLQACWQIKTKHMYDETVDEYICELDISKIVFVEI